MYGALVWALYSGLDWMGAPTFYDKLLCVPPLNLLVQPLDRAGAALESRFRQVTWTPKEINFAHMAVWIALFTVMIPPASSAAAIPAAIPRFGRKPASPERRTPARRGSAP